MPADPSSLRLQVYPAEVLRQKAEPVDATDDVRAVGRRMIEIMHESEGIGLAAPQVGLAWRLFVTDVRPREDDDEVSADVDPPSAEREPCVYINPVIERTSGPPEIREEGCLSLPGLHGDVIRPPTVTLSYRDLEGRPCTRTATGLLARCWQHELDHLDGVLIIDRMTQMSRTKVRAQLKTLEQQAGRR